MNQDEQQAQPPTTDSPTPDQQLSASISAEPPEPLIEPNAPRAFERVISVDVLRGFALFGILAMNIISFGMPAAAYRNPASFNDDSLLNHVLYSVFHIFADQKAMGLFSLLFGASVMLLIKKLKTAGRGVKRWYYSRTLWLLVFGFAHGVLVWSGDILLIYASCGLLLYPFYRLWPSLQFGLGLLIFLSALTIDQRGQEFLESLPPQTIESLGTTIWSPSAFEIAYETEYIRGPYWIQVQVRMEDPETFQTPAMHTLSTYILYQGYARAFGLMLIGMAFFSWGILSGAQGLRFYRRMATIGIGAGASISAFGLWQLYRSNWSFTYGMFEGMRFNHVATLLLVMGYIGLILYLFKRTKAAFMFRGLAAVGRMAFSNYLMQSLICTSLFYGFGLGLFASFDRLQLLIIVIAIWIFQFCFSRFWLHYFHYGPMEWIWRTLTYFKLAPLWRRPPPGSQADSGS